jgi:hypothetical protein
MLSIKVSRVRGRCPGVTSRHPGIPVFNGPALQVSGSSFTKRLSIGEASEGQSGVISRRINVRGGPTVTCHSFQAFETVLTCSGVVNHCMGAPTTVVENFVMYIVLPTDNPFRKGFSAYNVGVSAIEVRCAGSACMFSFRIRYTCYNSSIERMIHGGWSIACWRKTWRYLWISGAPSV